MRRSIRTWLVLGIASTLGLAACSSGSGGVARKKQVLPDCPVNALDNVTAPVEITMWHTMAEGNEPVLKSIAADFNASQSKVKVNPVLLPTYDAVLEKVRAAKTTGDLAEVAQIEDRQMQTVVDTDVFLPVQACVNASNYSFADYLPAVADLYKIDGVLQAMPFNISTPILYYDKSDFTKAGLDPEKPPTTLDELKTAAEKLKAVGIPIPFTWESNSWYLEEWLAMGGDYFVNGDNGRKAIADEALFNDKTGQDVFAWLASMKKAGLIENYKRDGGYTNLYKIAFGEATMSIWSNAALGTALNLIQGGGLPDKQLVLGAGPMPGPSGGGLAASGGGLYISKKASPQKIAGAWQWLQYLNTPAVQAKWAIGTGFYPTTKAAAAEPNLQAFWQKQPAFRVGYDQLLKSSGTGASTTPIIGPYSDVRKPVEEAMTAVVANGANPKSELSNAAKRADVALKEYADRAGG